MDFDQTAVLRFKIPPNGWIAPPHDVWQKILENFIFELADSFTVLGIKSQDQLARETIFNFIDMSKVPFMRVREESAEGDRSATKIGVFELTETAKSVFRFAPLDRVRPDPDNHCISDEIHFLAGPQCLCNTGDSDLFFPELNFQYYELLCSVHPTIKANLWTLSDLTVPFEPS